MVIAAKLAMTEKEDRTEIFDKRTGLRIGAPVLRTGQDRQVVELLRHEIDRRDVAAIMVTHDERVVDLGDRIVEMVDGRIRD